eukprot:TRINITY_DN4422_c0_g1_i6.p1 TRINITY_DN4422_c0_g1~~TRINITY_DN4422_c0_g1_i6.p1  ORF type:complete len:267 (-),score=11.95 TRINITY_DN4422_c0_g1_i6:827-1582(-)
MCIRDRRRVHGDLRIQFPNMNPDATGGSSNGEDQRITNETSLGTMELEKPQTERPQKSNMIQAGLNLFKCFVGTGILALPYSYEKVGIITGSLEAIIVGAIILYGMILLLRVVDERNEVGVTLSELALKVVGPKLGVFTDINIMFVQFSVCIGILIVSRTFLDHIICHLGYADLCGNVWVPIGIAVLIVFPLSFIDNLHFFYYSSAVATMIVFTASEFVRNANSIIHSWQLNLCLVRQDQYIGKRSQRKAD